ncbi:hypothetical protein AB431_28570 [Mycobacterium sp. EPa45]|nr:hypothetical protein AB431_28570 [Mycobacterium sp. EPa45]
MARLADAERAVIRAIKAHLAEIDPPPDEPPELSTDQPPATPTDVLRDLLDRSMYSRPDDSRTALYLSLLQELLPDEARILAALSDGASYPVIDIAEPLLGTSTALVLTNASTVGRAAGVSLPHHTPLYVSRLVLAGLAVIGPEGGNAMYDDYEMLLTDAVVNMAIAKARRGIRSARVIRRTVRISELGQELWEAAK